MGKQHYHFIGIGGIGMSALAHILLDRGYSVSGSDLLHEQTAQSLMDKGAQCSFGHHRENVPLESVVVYTSGISKDNPEMQEAMRLSLPMMHRSELLARLIEPYLKIMVTGSHGKTTVSSLITAILQMADQDPSFAIGGLNHQGLNGYAGKTPYFVAEADESDGSLQYYEPDIAVITNIGNEHISNFHGNQDALQQSILAFAKRASLSLWYLGDCKDLQGLRGVSFGFSPSCDLWISEYCQQGWKSVFSISFQGTRYQDIEVSLLGKHNVANAAVAMGVALSLGIEEKVIRKALAQFPGVKRRMERKNRSETFLFFDDYAHHPIEIKNTLKALREAIEGRRLIAICQPHRFTRIQTCYQEFLHAFQEVDHLIFTDVYSAGEKCNNFDYQEFMRRVAHTSGVPSVYVPYGDLSKYVKSILRVHDVCVSLGAGSITHLGTEFLDYRPQKLKVGILCGGRSCEHDVSLLSARNFSAHVSSEWYEKQYFVVDRQGLWCWGESLEVAKEQPGVSLFAMMEHLQQVDFVLPILHGTYGEDGVMQGFLEMIEKPYGGPSVLSAAVGMDKVLTKMIAEAVGIPVVPYMHITAHQWRHSPDMCRAMILEKFAFPLFVKAVHLGSSLGVFEVRDMHMLETRIQEIFRYDSDLLIEESRVGCREIEVACLGEATSYRYLASCCERRGRSGAIDYLEKYGFGGCPSADIILNADLPDHVRNRVQQLAAKMFLAIRGSGSCRIDFFVHPQGDVWLSEVNTIPGMTATSPFLLAFERDGWSGEQIAHQMIIDGLRRFDQRQRLDQSLVDLQAEQVAQKQTTQVV